MAELLTASQMRAIETAAIGSGEVTGLELMERAGRGVVEAVFEEWPELAKTSHRAVVLCGPGNNGGDGFVVARLLREWGWEVEAYLYGDPEKLPPDAKVNFARWQAMGTVRAAAELVERTTKPDFDADAPDPDLLVDAAFGTGLTRDLPPEIVAIAAALNDREPPAAGSGWIVSVDLPSGLCSDSGRVIGAEVDAVIYANLTVTFHAEKLAHRLSAGPEICGKTVVKDIGLRAISAPGSAAQRAPDRGRGGWAPERVACRTVAPPEAPLLAKRTGAHKYAHGHALVLSGGAGRTGAARLAARGALRIGAGLVTLGVPGAAQLEAAAQLTAVMLRRVDGAEGLAEVLEDRRLNALCLGPGLGPERARALVPVALGAEVPGLASGRRRCVVLDADALAAYAEAPEALFGMLHGDCVLTPHGGEFARLFPDLAERLAATPTRGPAYSKVDATREAAARAGCVILFKGADTVIASPEGDCAISSAHYERAVPWLATAGAGDVLAGFVAGLLARGLAPMQAAETAAWLHVECARVFGPGLIAEDLPEALPGVLRRLGV